MTCSPNFFSTALNGIDIEASNCALSVGGNPNSPVVEPWFKIFIYAQHCGDAFIFSVRGTRSHSPRCISRVSHCFSYANENGHKIVILKTMLEKPQLRAFTQILSTVLSTGSVDKNQGLQQSPLRYILRDLFHMLARSGEPS